MNNWLNNPAFLAYAISCLSARETTLANHLLRRRRAHHHRAHAGHRLADDPCGLTRRPGCPLGSDDPTLFPALRCI